MLLGVGGQQWSERRTITSTAEPFLKTEAEQPYSMEVTDPTAADRRRRRLAKCQIYRETTSLIFRRNCAGCWQHFMSSSQVGSQETPQLQK